MMILSALCFNSVVDLHLFYFYLLIHKGALIKVNIFANVICHILKTCFQVSMYTDKGVTLRIPKKLLCRLKLELRSAL